MINGTIDETMIDRYYVLVVDSCDIVLAVAGMLPKQGGQPYRQGCCKNDAYKLKLQVALPPKFHRFNVMAAKDSTARFIVQGGLSSGPIIDLVPLGTVSRATSLSTIARAFSLCVAMAALRTSL